MMLWPRDDNGQRVLESGLDIARPCSNLSIRPYGG